MLACMPCPPSWCSTRHLMCQGNHPDIPMQGSNAHVVMEVNSSEAPGSVMDPGSQMWQRSRHWFVPAAHPLLQQVSGGSGGQMRFSGLVAHPGLAHLGDCCSNGKAMLPAGILLEVRCARMAATLVS